MGSNSRASYDRWEGGAINRFRYGAYDDGPDPLAAPYDAGRAVDELGDRVLDGLGVRDAVRDLLKRGADGVRGLDDLLRKVQQRRRSLERSGRLAPAR